MVSVGCRVLAGRGPDCDCRCARACGLGCGRASCPVCGPGRGRRNRRFGPRGLRSSLARLSELADFWWGRAGPRSASRRSSSERFGRASALARYGLPLLPEGRSPLGLEGRGFGRGASPRGARAGGRPEFGSRATRSAPGAAAARARRNGVAAIGEGAAGSALVARPG